MLLIFNRSIRTGVVTLGYDVAGITNVTLTLSCYVALNDQLNVTLLLLLQLCDRWNWHRSNITLECYRTDFVKI